MKKYSPVTTFVTRPIIATRVKSLTALSGTRGNSPSRRQSTMPMLPTSSVMPAKCRISPSGHAHGAHALNVCARSVAATQAANARRAVSMRSYSM
jgi:hypothetical protein